MNTKEGVNLTNPEPSNESFSDGSGSEASRPFRPHRRPLSPSYRRHFPTGPFPTKTLHRSRPRPGKVKTQDRNILHTDRDPSTVLVGGWVHGGTPHPDLHLGLTRPVHRTTPGPSTRGWESRDPPTVLVRELPSGPVSWSYRLIDLRWTSECFSPGRNAVRSEHNDILQNRYHRLCPGTGIHLTLYSL